MVPYQLDIPKSQIEDMRRRIREARWPQEIKGAGWERGIPISYMKELAAYWSDSFDWNAQQAQINQYRQLTTEIDGQTIHLFHVHSKKKGALPLLLLHGWPSCSIEYLKIIEPLSETFDLVIPTIPGFGLYPPVRETGWQSVRTAKAYAELMRRLGYERYGAHGSDIGADILGELEKIDGERLIGAHSATDTHTLVLSVSMFMGGGDPAQSSKLSERQKERVREIQAEWKDGLGYLQIQSTRPQTIGYAFNDSPVAQLAWQAEKLKAWTSPSDLPLEKKIDLDQALTIVSLYWLMGAGASSANYIYENMRSTRDWSARSRVPAGQAVFGAEDIARPLGDPEYNMRHWSEYKEGRHFPAMEVPALLVRDLRKFFGDLENS